MVETLDIMSEAPKNTRSTITTSVGQRLRDLRKRRGFTQQEFGRQCFGAAAQARVSHYENGRREPSIDDLRIMARVLGVSINELVSGEKRRSVETISGIPLLPIAFFKRQQGKIRMAKRVLERLPVPAGLAVSSKAFAVRMDARSVAAVRGEFSDGDLIICDRASTRIRPNQYVWVTLQGEDLPTVRLYSAVKHAVRSRGAVLHGAVVAKLKLFT